MARKKSQKRNFNGMSYGELQRANSAKRSKLQKSDQVWLKTNGYRNVGWDNAINLYQKIEEFLRRVLIEDMSLEELFLEADRIGSKYQTPEEIEAAQRQLSQETSEIETLIDQQFPDTEIEVIDYSKTAQATHKKRNQKTYRTAKL